MKQAIVARTDLDMGTGKLAAQVAHAALRAAEDADPEARRTWAADGQKKVVLKAAGEAQLLDLADRARRASLPTALVRDAGHTQVEPGTITTLGVGPGPDDVIDSVTGDLSLY